MDNDKDKPYNIYYAYYEYDERGLLIGEIRQSKHNNKRPLTIKYIYDENLNLTQEIFEQGNSDHYTYENNRRIKKEEIELNGRVYSTTNYYYENNSILEEEINSDGIVTRYSEKIFDLDGNVVEIRGYDGIKTLIYNIIYENDGYGNPLKTYSTWKNKKNTEIKEFLYQ
ncbi:MAG: hypothetical protein IPM96_17440 [Ignavibacteria bacterium]|nr:hypothetical protein [Ignavibacteria bacterium]